ALPPAAARPKQFFGAASAAGAAAAQTAFGRPRCALHGRAGRDYPAVESRPGIIAPIGADERQSRVVNGFSRGADATPLAAFKRRHQTVFHPLQSAPFTVLSLPTAGAE